MTKRLSSLIHDDPIQVSREGGAVGWQWGGRRPGRLPLGCGAGPAIGADSAIGTQVARIRGRYTRDLRSRELHTAQRAPYPGRVAGKGNMGGRVELHQDSLPFAVGEIDHSAGEVRPSDYSVGEGGSLQ